MDQYTISIFHEGVKPTLEEIRKLIQEKQIICILDEEYAVIKVHKRIFFRVSMTTEQLEEAKKLEGIKVFADETLISL